MNVLALDPGNEETAWCTLELGKLTAAGKAPNQTVLECIRAGAWTYDKLLAVEMIASYGMPVGREVFETCLWIGRFLEAWDRAGGKLHRLVYRRDVKLFHCESVRATDANVRAALIDRFGPGKAKAIGKKASPGPLYGLKGDTWSALAIALTVQGTTQ